MNAKTFLHVCVFLIGSGLLSSSAHALVVAPILVIPVLKLTILFVSGLSIPIIAFFQLLKKTKRLRVFFLSLLALLLVFFITYGFLTLRSYLSSDRPVSRVSNNSLFIIGTAKDVSLQDRVLNTIGVRSKNSKFYNTQGLIYVLIKLTIGIAMLLCMPVLIGFYIFHATKKLFSVAEYVLLSLLTVYLLSFSTAFILLCMVIYS